MSKKLSQGVVHTIPTDMRVALLSTDAAYTTWQDITPLARNEWICWVMDAKKQETREKRIRVGMDKLSKGDRRPCCWPGCSHRTV